MKSIHTLTVPDVMWVNLQICRRQEPWNYATLEEAVFNQYSYGDSVDIVERAARLILGFNQLKPFRTGNEATSFVSAIAFLSLNGKELHLDDADAAEWFLGALTDNTLAGIKAKLEVISKDHDVHFHHGVPDIHETLESVLADYPKAVASLAQTGHTASLV